MSSNMPERSRSDLLIQSVLEGTWQGGVEYETPGGHRVKVRGRIRRGDDGSIQGVGVGGAYRTPGGHEFTAGWEHGGVSQPPTNIPAPEPTPAPAEPAPTPEPAREEPAAPRRRSPRRRKAAAEPAAPAAEDELPRVEVDTATVHARVTTGQVNAATARAKAKAHVRNIMRQRMAVTARTNPFEGARARMMPMPPFPERRPKPETSADRIRRSAFKAGIGGLAAVASTRRGRKILAGAARLASRRLFP